MKILTKFIFGLLRLIFRDKHDIVLENLALRQQLVVQKRSIKRPKIKNADRIFWVWLSRFWNNWRSSLIIVSLTSVWIADLIELGSMRHASTLSEIRRLPCWGRQLVFLNLLLGQSNLARGVSVQ